jgi:hypothetical protein
VNLNERWWTDGFAFGGGHEFESRRVHSLFMLICR